MISLIIAVASKVYSRIHSRVKHSFRIRIQIGPNHFQIVRDNGVGWHIGVVWLKALYRQNAALDKLVNMTAGPLQIQK